MTRRVYTVAAVAEEIGKSTAWVEQEIRQGRLIVSKRAGQTPLILAADFDSYLNGLPDA